MLLFLIGFMGAGKTTVGKQFAAQSDFQFMDLDDCIIKQAGMSIPQIFEKEGEIGFRKREKYALHQLQNLPNENYLIACGGGTPCFGDNMQWMNDHGLTVYLRPGIPELAKRLIKEQAQRPLIRDVHPDDLEGFISEMLVGREAYYMQAEVVLEGAQNTLERLKGLMKQGK